LVQASRFAADVWQWDVKGLQLSIDADRELLGLIGARLVSAAAASSRRASARSVFATWRNSLRSGPGFMRRARRSASTARSRRWHRSVIVFPFVEHSTTA